MRTLEEVKRELVQQWLTKADEDLGLSAFLVFENTSYLAAVGFHAQQAAEKYLKAFLVFKQREFPKTHDLGKLLDLVASVDTVLSDSLQQITYLSPFGVEFRYPGDYPNMSMEDARKALSMAELVRDSIVAALANEERLIQITPATFLPE